MMKENWIFFLQNPGSGSAWIRIRLDPDFADNNTYVNNDDDVRVIWTRRCLRWARRRLNVWRPCSPRSISISPSPQTFSGPGGNSLVKLILKNNAYPGMLSGTSDAYFSRPWTGFLPSKGARKKNKGKKNATGTLMGKGIE